MIRVFNIVYDTNGEVVDDLPAALKLPNRAIRTEDRRTVGARLAKLIERDWLIVSFDYQLPGDASPTHYRDDWVGSTDHLEVKAELAAYSLAHAGA